MLGRDPFLVINSDIFTDMPAPGLRLHENHLGHLVTVPKPVHLDRGDFSLDEGLLRRTGDCRFTFAGFAIYRPELFAACERRRFSIAPLLFAAADAGRLSGSVYEGRWADIGTPERLAAVRHSAEIRTSG